MLENASLLRLLGLVAIFAPVALVCLLGLMSLIDKRLREDAVGRACMATTFVGLVATVGVLLVMLLQGTRHEAVGLGEWIVVPGYHLSLKLVFDRLSVPMAILSFVLCGTIAAFATRYLHREPGYHRFFVLFSLFVLGMVLTSLAGTIETLFAGWEFVGLSSALLVAYFQERAAPPRNGLRVWIVYRISDAALLLASIALHNLSVQGDFDRLLSGGAWPDGQATIGGAPALFIGLLLIIAAAGKSALVPFSNWLPRAMEGPTPSSAIFYGALSVHLGAFLLLRASPILDASLFLSMLVVALGISTALYAYLAGSVQSDIKSALAFASLAQVGLIVAEIGFGFRYLPLVHLLGNACLRTLQFLRAPTLLHDYHLLENAIGGRRPDVGVPWIRLLPEHLRICLYRFALERGYFDIVLYRWIIAPMVRLLRWCDQKERRWTNFLAGKTSQEGTAVPPTAMAWEELP